MFPEFAISKPYMERYPGVGFGLTLISGCRDVENPPAFKPFKKRHLRKMRKRETLAQITGRIDIYADFFAQFEYPWPLVNHLKRTINSGFPRYNLLVDDRFLTVRPQTDTRCGRERGDMRGHGKSRIRFETK